MRRIKKTWRLIVGFQVNPLQAWKCAGILLRFEDGWGVDAAITGTKGDYTLHLTRGKSIGY